MNDFLARQVVRRGDFGGARGAAVQGAAFCEEGGAGGSVDGAVDAAAAEQGGVRRVDDGGDGEVGYGGAEVGDCGVEGVGGGVGGGWGGGVQVRELVEEGEGGDFGEGDWVGGGHGWWVEVEVVVFGGCCDGWTEENRGWVEMQYERRLILTPRAVYRWTISAHHHFTIHRFYF